jgi:prepilin-type processing-associated H-X9-DG protein
MRTVAALNEQAFSEIENTILLIANSSGILNQLFWDGHLYLNATTNG